MRKYNSYHTSLKLLAKKGSLPKNYSSKIDRSTLWRWNKEPDDKYVGTESGNIELLEDFISRKEAQKIMKAYIKVALSVGSVISSSKAFYNILKKNKAGLINVLLQHKKDIDFNLVLRLLKIPTSVFHYWKNKMLYKCTNSPLQLCKRIYPNQLTENEVSVIKELTLSEKFRYWPVCSIAWYALRENLLHISLATWYKYINILGINRPRITVKKRYEKGITASTPNEIWHADITVVKCLDGIKSYVYLLMDNYSKYIINWRVEPVVSGSIRVQTIKEGYQKHILPGKDVQLIIDGGPENNNSEMDGYISSDRINIQKLVALKDIPFSNSLIEAQNKLLKYRYLFKCQYRDINELRRKMSWIIPDFNYDRPHNSLKGLTPYEAHTGKTPDMMNTKFKIIQAKQNRVIENRKKLCEICK